MSQENSTATDSQNMTKPKKRWMTAVLLLVLLGVGLYAVDRSVNGKFFQAVKDTTLTTIGGGMNDEQKQNVDKFEKRLNDLRSQRDAIAKGEVEVPATDDKPSEDKPADVAGDKPAESLPATDAPPTDKPTETPNADTPAGEAAPTENPPAADNAEKKDGA